MFQECIGQASALLRILPGSFQGIFRIFLRHDMFLKFIYIFGPTCSGNFIYFRKILDSKATTIFQNVPPSFQWIALPRMQHGLHCSDSGNTLRMFPEICRRVQQIQNYLNPVDILLIWACRHYSLIVLVCIPVVAQCCSSFVVFVLMVLAVVMVLCYAVVCSALLCSAVLCCIVQC